MESIPDTQLSKEAEVAAPAAPKLHSSRSWKDFNNFMRQLIMRSLAIVAGLAFLLLIARTVTVERNLSGEIDAWFSLPTCPSGLRCDPDFDRDPDR